MPPRRVGKISVGKKDELRKQPSRAAAKNKSLEQNSEKNPTVNLSAQRLGRKRPSDKAAVDVHPSKRSRSEPSKPAVVAQIKKKAVAPKAKKGKAVAAKKKKAATPKAKKEKAVAAKKEEAKAPKANQPIAVVQPYLPTASNSTPVAAAPVHIPSNVNDNGELIFTCASCQYQTVDEQEFMKHTRTDHRSDLSMWCKQCGKCLSNAGVLVAHIKERACIKEEMIYKCGAKDCSFETTSGQTFVPHLRHCHKGSPFICCVHCQKIFTLPHCLILHMQDDCPFKERNRKNPGSVAASPLQPASPATPSSGGQTPSPRGKGKGRGRASSSPKVK